MFSILIDLFFNIVKGIKVLRFGDFVVCLLDKDNFMIFK